MSADCPTSAFPHLRSSTIHTLKHFRRVPTLRTCRRMPSIFKKFTKVEEQQTTSASSLSLPNLNSAYNVFTFHPDNPCNTEIRTSTGRVAYRIDTTTTELNTLTVVRNSFGSVLATLEWKEFLSDRVTLGTGNPMSLNSWLKRSLMPFSTYVFISSFLISSYTNFYLGRYHSRTTKVESTSGMVMQLGFS